MKNSLLVVVGLVLLYSMAIADSSGYGISFGYGEAEPNIDIHRLGLKKGFSSQWFQSDIGYASGYFELSFNHWEYNNEDIIGLAFSPVYVYHFGNESDLFNPYIEGGIGVTYIDGYGIAGRDLSTNFQFEDRIGAGAKIGMFDLSFRYMHYSNASIKGSNDGMDIWIFTTAIQF